MPKIRFSQDQQKAINAEGHVIVSAGAGSGKTAVMIERIVKKLLSGYKLDDMLIVTFTRASAADMRVKLADRLSELKKEGGEKASIAIEAINALPVANIGTLHSFCQRLIRNYFYAADVDPASTIMDDCDVKRHKRAAIMTAIRRMREKSTDEYELLSSKLREDISNSELVDEYGKEAELDTLSAIFRERRSDENLLGAVLKTLEYALSLSHPYAYLDGVSDDSDCFDTLDELLNKKRDEIVYEINLLTADVRAVNFKKIEPAVNDLIPYIDGKIDSITSTRVTKPNDVENELNTRLKELKDWCKKVRKLLDSGKAAKKCNSVTFVRTLCSLAKDALETYSSTKRTLAKIDYSDLEHGALRVLADERCLAELSEQVKLVFIDEYQDVNPLQAEIAERLKSGANAEMFLVGDVKQSIYGFRRCDPKYFIEALSNPEYTQVYLNDNYRSSSAVIDFVNTVFDGVMKEDFGGANYSDNMLVCGKKGGKAGRAEFVGVFPDEYDYNLEAEKLLNKLEAVKKKEAEINKQISELPSFMDSVVYDDVWGVYSVVKASKHVDDTISPQARFILDKILKYVRGGDKKSGEVRSFSDVAVLCRSIKTGFCEELTGYLRRCGVPCRIGRGTVGDSAEAMMLLNILRYVDNRYDDVALYTALRSPMGGFSDEELLSVAVNGERRAVEFNIVPEHNSGKKVYAFWQKVDVYKGELSERLCEFKRLREKFVDVAARANCAELMSVITSEIDFFQYVFERGGNAAAINAMLADGIARRLDLSSYLVTVNEDTELVTSDGGDAVTISTIHASKGLEYEYVIVADITREFNLREASETCIISDRVGLKYPDYEGRKLVETAPWLIENITRPNRLREEELRLFYVALTRAKTYLTVCCPGFNRYGNSNKKHKPREALSEYDFMANISHGIAIAPKPKVEAKKMQPPLDDRITAAVQDACSYKYERPSLLIKTCVTAISEGGAEAVFVITDDDRGVAYEDEEVYGSDGVVGCNSVDASESGADGEIRSPKTYSVDAATRGTAYHSAMEHVDFNNPDMVALSEQCLNFDCVDKNAIIKAAEVMKELSSGGTVIRERPFIVDLPINSIDDTLDGISGLSGKESVLLQGVIDALIVFPDGRAIIVDYKTSSPQLLKSDGYKKQLNLYTQAVERATANGGKPLKVVNKYLYSFVLGKLIEVE